MKETRQEPHSNASLSCAGKVFLLGEYAVLSEGPGILAAVGPRFTFDLESGDQSLLEMFPVGSPAQRLAQSYPDQSSQLKASFFDPHQGAGGFGASTAQFILSSAALQMDMEVGSLWRRYRELTSDKHAVPPSGADLVCQLMGGFVLFDGKAIEDSFSIRSQINGDHFLVFSATGQAGRKTPTHEHLKELVGTGFPQKHGDLLEDLEQWVWNGREAIERGSLESLGNTLDIYGDTLARHGLEVEATAKDREALRPLKGVLGVKGSGALQSDAIIVLVEDPKSSDVDKVLEVAQSRGLKCVARGLDLEQGLKK